MRPIYTCFYTKKKPGDGGADYEWHANKLRASLDRFGLQHDCREMVSQVGWASNSRMTATHIRNMQRDYPDRPIVQLDADCTVCSYPWIFDELESRRVDVAVHYRKGHEMLNGTLWLAPTEAARQTIQKYEELVISQGHNCHNEQRCLQSAIEEVGDFLRIEQLPAGYCFIPDIMANDLKPDEELVVRQFQASRDANCPGSEAHITRQRWLQEIDGYAMPKITAQREAKGAA